MRMTTQLPQLLFENRTSFELTDTKRFEVLSESCGKLHKENVFVLLKPLLNRCGKSLQDKFIDRNGGCSVTATLQLTHSVVCPNLLL